MPTDRYPTTGLLDVGRLLWSLLWALRKPWAFDPGLVLHNWLKGLIVRYRNDNVVLNLIVTRLLLVTDPDLSRHILAEPPSSTGFTAGRLKVKAMSYLAPQALTIADNEAWRKLRPFNEQVLATGRPHDLQVVFLQRVRDEFRSPIHSIDDIRDAMGRAMLSIVFGQGVAPDHLAVDIRILFDLVQKPLRRLLRGGKERRRVDGLYDAIRKAWDRNKADSRSLLGMAHRAGGQELDTYLQQVPHWMFTFSGSASDLLSRGLTLIGSRPEVGRRVAAEIAAAGPLDDPATINRLRYLEACLLEGARLFPPVTRTFHRAPEGDTALGIPPGIEIVQVFSLTQRDVLQDVTANDYDPDRWFAAAGRAQAIYPNLFLSGARACPGRDLILFICKAAGAHLMSEAGLTISSDLLARDPLPFSFPARRLSFAVRTSSGTPPAPASARRSA